MKNLIFFSFFIIYYNSFSQNSKTEHANFKLQENKELYWQKVYEYEASKDSIIKVLNNFISQNSFLNNLKLNNSLFTGYSNYTSITDTKGLSLAVQMEFNCFVKIEIKPNKYRITLSKVKFKPVKMDFGGIILDDPYELESLAVRSNYFELRKNSKSRKTLERINSDFISLLKIKRLNKDDW